MSAPVKGQQQDEYELELDRELDVTDDAKLERAAKAMLSPTPRAPSAGKGTLTTAGADLQGSVWEQWVSRQQAEASHNGIDTTDMSSLRARVASARRAASAEPALDPHRFDSALATGSGFTNTGIEATRERLAMLQATGAAEEAEISELKALLSRTLYTGGTNSYKRAGDVATASLQKLDDGQNDVSRHGASNPMPISLALLSCAFRLRCWAAPSPCAVERPAIESLRWQSIVTLRKRCVASAHTPPLRA